MSNRKSITFTPKAEEALGALRESLQLADSGVVCRAIEVFAFLQAELDKGNGFMVYDTKGNMHKIHII